MTQGTIGSFGDSFPVCQAAGIIGLGAKGAQVEDIVALALEQDKVAQSGVVEGTVWVAWETKLAAAHGEARLQSTVGIAPHSFA